jgi:aminotransferase class V
MSTGEQTAAPVYLDNAATTPVDPRVAQAISECLTRSGVFGNPSSQHAYGRMARARVEAARAQVGGLIGAPAAQIIWTSGATELHAPPERDRRTSAAGTSSPRARSTRPYSIPVGGSSRRASESPI